MALVTQLNGATPAHLTGRRSSGSLAAARSGVQSSFAVIKTAGKTWKIRYRGEETLIRDELFVIDKWQVDREREIAEPGQFAIAVCLTGEIECAGRRFNRGDFFLVPAQLENRVIAPVANNASLLRVTMPR